LSAAQARGTHKALAWAPGDEVDDASGWLSGTGADEGLSADVVWSYGTTEPDPWSHITAEGPLAMAAS
jgi:hypothetical protein